MNNKDAFTPVTQEIIRVLGALCQELGDKDQVCINISCYITSGFSHSSPNSKTLSDSQHCLAIGD